MQRQNLFSLIRFLRVMSLSLLVVMLGGLLRPEAAVQPVSFGPPADFGAGGDAFSVAVGDFNGDGKPDLAVANNSSDTVSILLGTGTGSFGPKTDFGTGGRPRSPAVGDFNGDGKLDLAVTNSSDNTISILLGTGTGSFGAKTDFGTGGSPSSVAVGDFNGDGKLDLAVANFSDPGSILDTVSILLGTGTGSFGAKTDFGAGNGPISVAVGDFNADGKLDLAVANFRVDTVSILLGTGTGSFGAKTDFGAGDGPNSVAVADFNGDGKLDLAVMNEDDDTVSILLGTGTGSFGAKTDFSTGRLPVSVAVGDFNGDGKLDLAGANSDDNTFSILLGTGTGSFVAKTDFGAGGFALSVAVGDFNGDGKLDLAVPNGNAATVSIMLNTTPIVCSGEFSPKIDFGTGIAPVSVAVGDFNGDGKLDLATANLFDGTVSILPGTGTGSFGAKTDFGTGSGTFSVAVGDFNGDGKLDLAVANFGSNTVSILLGTGTGTFGAKTDFGTGISPVSVAVGDLNGDGALDLAVANSFDDTVSILLGMGTGSFGTRTDFGTGSEPLSVAMGNFNGDGKLDLAVGNRSSNTVSILLGTGTGSFGAKTDFGTGTFPRSVAVGDFNGDGKLDLAAANSSAFTISILLGTGKGSLGVKTDFATGFVPGSVAVGDFNGDGKLDLAAANQGSETLSILLGTGTGSFGAKTDFDIGGVPASVALGDFNADGELDLAVANQTGSTVSVLLNACTADTPCAIVCPADITASNDPNQCGAVVSYDAPTLVGVGCGTIICSPASGSFFPVGTTTVSCTASGGGPPSAPESKLDAGASKSAGVVASGPIGNGLPRKETGEGSSLKFNTPANPVVILYDQNGAANSGAASQNFETGLDSFDCESADDFSVPPGETWNVTQVNAGGTFSVESGLASINVTFYNNSGNLPGSVVQSFSNIVTFSNAPNFNITLPSTVVLSGGATYWVSVQVNMNLNPNFHQWFWSNFGAANIGSDYAWRNPGGGFGTPCTTFGSGSTQCGLGPNRNNVFQIVGTSTTSGDGPSCTFTVTVVDTQAPTIACPANVTAVSANVAELCAVVSFEATASDNCPGATIVCNPPSGSCFPVGVTAVACTATDASGNTLTCAFTVTVFNGRLQDDSGGCNNSVLFNTITGDYRWCCRGTIFTGRAKVTRLGSTFTLQHNAGDRRVLIRLAAGNSPPSGTASLQSPPGAIRCVITDRDTRNDTCVCGESAP